MTELSCKPRRSPCAQQPPHRSHRRPPRRKPTRLRPPHQHPHHPRSRPHPCLHLLWWKPPHRSLRWSLPQFILTSHQLQHPHPRCLKWQRQYRKWSNPLRKWCRSLSSRCSRVGMCPASLRRSLPKLTQKARTPRTRCTSTLWLK